MQASTLVTRTAAGSAELAAPAHGLSLAQRRFLTLLDSACSIEALAARQPADAGKLARDLGRLASLGLVVFDVPAANDAHAALDAVRLGPPSTSSRLPYLLVAVAVSLLGLAAWRFLASSPAPVTAPGATRPDAVASPAPREPAAAPAEAIATRVLVSDPPVRPRDVVKDAPRPNAADAAPRTALAAQSPLPAVPPLQPIETRLAPQAFVAAPLALPVERRSPVVALAPAPLPESIAPPLEKRLVPIVQEQPAFPREAVTAGLASGNVKARLVVDAKGDVVRVDVIEASHRAFDRAVRDALSRWRFEPGAAGRSTTVDVAFKRD